MKSAAFEYARAASIAEVCDWLREDGDNTKLIAGGQSLVPMMAMRLTRPARLININEIDALKFIRLDPEGDIYLTLSGESRLRNWYESRPFLGTQAPHHSGRMTLRNLLGADLHLGEHLRVYGELINGDAFGWGIDDFEWITINAMKSAFTHFPHRLDVINRVIKPRYAAARSAARP